MKHETLEDFYTEKRLIMPDNMKGNVGHFNVFRLEECIQQGQQVQYARRDYYKISLLKGHNRYHYADKSLETDGTTLLFFNPKVPYTWENLGGELTGYFCIFTSAFFSEGMRNSVDELPMFVPGGKPSYLLNDEQENAIKAIFEKMLSELHSDYTFKYDLLRSYLNELLHTALKTEPAEKLYEHPNANSRITAVFHEMLERQFPIETPMQRFTMRSARDFANSLAVHVNHLNRAIRTTTGKTTTTLISERLVAEAMALLKHTDWNISEISNSLGFEEAAHFNNFFKKHTSHTPSYFRNV
ncbi:MAG TPA: helix-turn-helix transcriptional regulator [Flavobacterium sp.]|nr:helix-turn-helix transcriptional regulator [Flavobacterium sp.]